MRNFIRVIKALSDEIRVRILNLIIERECCVCEVIEALDISQTRASRNLGMLYDAGFLKHRREGLWAHYSLDTEGMTQYHLELIKSVKTALKGNQTTDQDLKRLKQLETKTASCSAK
jgi:ArsR family transcriptional regulator